MRARWIVFGLVAGALLLGSPGAVMGQEPGEGGGQEGGEQTTRELLEEIRKLNEQLQQLVAALEDLGGPTVKSDPFEICATSKRKTVFDNSEGGEIQLIVRVENTGDCPLIVTRGGKPEFGEGTALGGALIEHKYRAGTHPPEGWRLFRGDVITAKCQRTGLKCRWKIKVFGATGLKKDKDEKDKDDDD